VAVTPAFEQAPPIRGAPVATVVEVDVVATVVEVDVVAADEAGVQAAQEIPETLSATPGLSACVPSPIDCAVSTV